MFSGITELFPTGAYGCVLWKSFIFEVIWNLLFVMIVSGHLPNCARKRADAAKDHPGEENKMLSVVARGDGVGTSHNSRFTALPRGAASRNGAGVGRAPQPTTPSPEAAGAMGTVLAGHESSSDTALASLSPSWWRSREGWPGQKATRFFPPPVNLICFFSVLEGFVMSLYRGRRLHLK